MTTGSFLERTDRGDRGDTAKDQILADAAKVAEHSRSAGALSSEQVHRLLEAYYRHVSPDDLLQRDPVDVYGAARSHYRLAQSRPQGTAAVRVFTPTVEEHGWSASHTVVEVVIDDMPFLVDSVTMELSRQDRGIHLVVHPQITVRRDVAGNLQDLVDEATLSGEDGDSGATGETAAADTADTAETATAETDTADTDAGAIKESWIHVEIDRETDPADVMEIEAALRRVLRDVRESVEDWPKMRLRALEIVDELSAERALPLPAEEAAEARELLRWLADNHFTFLGYREYTLDRGEKGDALTAVRGSGLGFLRSDQNESQSFAVLPTEVRAKAREKRLLILTKANSRSSVHRPAYLDYIGVKTFDDAGEVTGERRFLGLFTSAAYTASIWNIPVLRRKAQEMLDRTGYTPDSHAGKALVDILETYPRDELFQISADDLLPTVRAVLQLQERRRLRLFLRRDDYGRYVSVLVYLPRERFNTEVRLRLQELLLDAFGSGTIDWTLRFSDSVLARLYFVVRLPKGSTVTAAQWAQSDVEELQEKLASATRTWQDDFSDVLDESVGEEAAARLRGKYYDAFPAAYREDFTARTAVSDLRRLEDLSTEGGLGLSLYEPVDAAPNERRFKIYRTGTALSLSDVLPRLTRMGVEVVDERPYEIVSRDGTRSWVYDFGLVYKRSAGDPTNGVRELFQEAFAAVWSGQAESDGFNALVLCGGLHWRQAMVLRAYAKYMRQTGSTFSQNYIEDALVGNVGLAKLLVELFETRFDPGLAASMGERAQETDKVAARIEAALEEVQSLDQDRIVRSVLTLIRTTLRTNYFQNDSDQNAKSYVSFKLDPQGNPELPEPRPAYEIWVYSPRVEGVHLRFGPVARGGLRWSDRREDFRTEILGLAKAQMVKNTVIVPVGAKGGFFAKRLPDPSNREAWQAEGVEAYRTFISGLLDITDNLSRGSVVPPRDVIRHDGDDSYLVVAPDKGTAAFSDIANEVAKSYGFWLGDAFASGGSAGYDHKAMGITARGAWESVKRHFRDMDRDCQSQDFTCVGIGDMSGDVFGNGMLCSQYTRLIAAFDHRHIFIDPDPDPSTSYEERRRLFELPRSSWADYASELISRGGGVYRRTAKSIPITSEAREALGIESDKTKLTPAELIRAILKAPVDLLWNGGIGTYVKASAETHASVGDKASESLRINGDELRAKCVGEGGNLGLTQLGRIEYAQHGGRIATDFIDNSAGVDTSDHEVNIKILLDQQIRDGDLTFKQRGDLLVAMTDEIADHVLDNNYAQNVALQNALSIGPAMMHVHADWLKRLEQLGLIDRELEFLPTPKQLRDLQANDRGLTAPELAVLLSYTKIVLSQELLASNLPDDPYLRRELVAYFPDPMRERYASQIAAHPLRREIIATKVVNDLVNVAGTTFYHRLSLETGVGAADLARAHVVARSIFGIDEILTSIRALDCEIPAHTQTSMRLEARTIAERASRWVVQNRRPPLDMEETVSFFDSGLASLMEALPDVLSGRELSAFEGRRSRLLTAGVPAELADRVAVLPPAYAGLGIVQTSRRTGTPLLEVARVHYALGERLELGRLLERILVLPRGDRWQTTARAALRDDLHNVHAELTFNVLGMSDAEADVPADEKVAAWEEKDAGLVAKTRSTLTEIVEGDVADLARLSVGLQVVRRLLPAAR